MNTEQNNSSFRTPHSELIASLRVAICGNLPTACDYLLRQGVVQIDKYLDAT